MRERTLVMIKPDAVERGLIGEILSRFEQAGLLILGMRMVSLSKRDAERFYAEHRGKSFFKRLTTMMSSAPIVAFVVSGKGAINRVRDIMGATDPADAAEGTIRKDFALGVTKNSVHGSDCPASAAREIAFFFNAIELCNLCEERAEEE